MKLSEIRKISQNLTVPSQQIDFNQLQPLLQQLGYSYKNLYQELEMDSPYADTHMDISFSNANLQFHSHAFYELICCHNTCGAEYLVGTERYKLQKGDIIFVPPDISHRAILPEHVTEPYKRDVLWISTDFMASVMSINPEHIPLAFQGPMLFRTAGTHWTFICELFHTGVKEASQQNIGWEAMVISNSLAILTHLYRASKDMQAKPLKAEKPELVDQVLAYIEQHLSEKITLADIAHHFFVSESTITQTFRKKMNVSFYRCVTQRRLIAAKTQIEKGFPLDHVSEQVGFSDYSSFFRAFKQEYGISPRQYRKMQTGAEGK
ncbi:MAG: helix-turn-helix transcriptional regulator [Oscillospiraceae bacterium]|nr:helix-turn-helix transcriptional regulator [Oscillospiraceae bacterium]